MASEFDIPSKGILTMLGNANSSIPATHSGTVFGRPFQAYCARRAANRLDIVSPTDAHLTENVIGIQDRRWAWCGSSRVADTATEYMLNKISCDLGHVSCVHRGKISSGNISHTVQLMFLQDTPEISALSEPALAHTHHIKVMQTEGLLDSFLIFTLHTFF